MTKKCSDCYYGDKCPSSSVCEFYTPVGEEAEDLEVEEFIEQQRKEFQEEWDEYIAENEE